MNTLKPQLRRRVISITPSATRVQPSRTLALLLASRVMNLAELARFIGDNQALRQRVTEAASRELGWPLPNVEQAIVLLGQQRLCALLAAAETSEGETI